MEHFYIYAFRISPMDENAADVLVALLADAGFDSFEQTDTGVNAYVASGQVGQADVEAVLSQFVWPDVAVSYSVSELEDKDWNEQWEQEGFKPIDVPGYDIKLRPRMAFGSGSHETTSQLVKLLLQQDFGGKRVLDMGCGTGILSICMALRGAEQVVAIDIDERSVDNTRENCALNKLDRIHVVHGDASAIAGSFDCIVANIHRNIIVADMPIYAQHLNAGGQLIVSGFFTADVPAIEAAARAAGLTLRHQQSLADWAVVEFSN